MKNKWYKKVGNQAAIIGGVFFLVAALIAKCPNKQSPPQQTTLDTLTSSQTYSGQDGKSEPDTSRITFSPKQLRDILDKNPPIQASEIYDKYYRGRIAVWQGTVLYASKRVSLLTDTSYSVILKGTDGADFIATFGAQWGKRTGTLSKGDSLLVRGKLGDFTPGTFFLQDCIILDN